MGYFATSACPAVAIRNIEESRPGVFPRSPSSAASFASKPQELHGNTELTGTKTRIGVPTGRSILSTKYLDQETGLYYYGYRFYNPSLGRWPNRDPMGEKGGTSRYQFVNNAPFEWFDGDGLFARKWITVLGTLKNILWPTWKVPIDPVGDIPDGAEPLLDNPAGTLRVKDCKLTKTRDNCVGLAGIYECRYTCNVFVNWFSDNNSQWQLMGTVLRILDFSCCPKPKGCPGYPDEPEKWFWGPWRKAL